MKTRLLALVLLPAAAFAGNREFDRVVKTIEHQYGVQRTRIPLLGVANFFVKVIRPVGTSSFHLAVFENLRSPRDEAGEAELDRFMASLESPKLHPMIRVHSRSEGESTYILTGEPGKHTEMLIVTVERHEAVVVHVTVNTDTLMKTINDPVHAGHMFSGRDRDRDRNRDMD